MLSGDDERRCKLEGVIIKSGIHVVLEKCTLQVGYFTTPPSSHRKWHTKGTFAISTTFQTPIARSQCKHYTTVLFF